VQTAAKTEWPSTQRNRRKTRAENQGRKPSLLWAGGHRTACLSFLPGFRPCASIRERGLTNRPPRFVIRKKLLRIASAIVRDQIEDGTAEKPTDEKRGDEVVSSVVTGVIDRVMAGKVRNVREYTKWSVRVQARLEMGKVWYKLGHVTRPRPESRTMSDVAQEAAMQEQY
jgi:hypothetical protein